MLHMQMISHGKLVCFVVFVFTFIRKNSTPHGINSVYFVSLSFRWLFDTFCLLWLARFWILPAKKQKTPKIMISVYIDLDSHFIRCSPTNSECLAGRVLLNDIWRFAGGLLDFNRSNRLAVNLTMLPNTEKTHTHTYEWRWCTRAISSHSAISINIHGKLRKISKIWMKSGQRQNCTSVMFYFAFVGISSCCLYIIDFLPPSILFA